jgi:hypothetical protein
MMLKKKAKILIILLSAVVLGLTTTFITDCFTKTTTSPTNIIYSADNVLYLHAPLVSVTQSKERGIPFISKAKVVNKYSNERIPGPSITLHVPAISSTGSNSFASILVTWQFYADILTWIIVWLFLSYLIRTLKHKRLN